jgi:hypothetical protein
MAHGRPLHQRDMRYTRDTVFVTSSAGAAICGAAVNNDVEELLMNRRSTVQ